MIQTRVIHIDVAAEIRQMPDGNIVQLKIIAHPVYLVDQNKVVVQSRYEPIPPEVNQACLPSSAMPNDFFDDDITQGGRYPGRIWAG
jgi:hypothetical protein